MRLWKHNSKQAYSVLRGHTQVVTGLRLLPRELNQLASVALDGCVRVWDVNKDGVCAATVRVQTPLYEAHLRKSDQGVHRAGDACIFAVSGR